MNRFIKSLLLVLFVGFFVFLAASMASAQQERISLFPIEHYSQRIADWMSPADPDYDKPLLSQQQQTFFTQELFRHYFSSDPGALSPWNPEYVNTIYSRTAPNDLYTIELQQLNELSNQNKTKENTSYGENFRPLTTAWFEKIANNIHFEQFRALLKYDSSHRAIAIDNLNARILPTDEVHFYHYSFAGQGYPFDNLQASAVWAGTPLYILGESLDRGWYMVLTPDYYIAWVKSTGVARVDNQFVAAWQQKAKNQLVGITQTNIPVFDAENQLYRFSGYVGMLFPGEMKEGKGVQILIPVRDENHQAHIHYAYLSSDQAALVPLPPTMRQFSNIMSQLINRPYGWGNMYFYNDCSGETKNLFASFGIWLPRHSSQQVNPERVPGQFVDLSNSSSAERLNYLKQSGHKLMTLVYIGGHVLLYVGQYPNPNPDPSDISHHFVALSYQNMWGFRPKDATPETDTRVVVGGSVLLPLLEQYPEDPNLSSELSKKYFQLMFFDAPLQTRSFRATGLGNVDLHDLLFIGG